MSRQSNLTVKGQVTIPKDIRDALGLKPGEPVEFDTNDSGETVIRAATESRYDRRRNRILADLREARSRFRTQDTMPGLSTDEFMDLVRGPPAEI